MKRRLPSSSAGRAAKQWPPPQNFTDLWDTFASYAGKAGQFITVNATETKLVSIPLPPLAITDTFVVNSQAQMLALVAQTGDVAIRTDINQSFILQGTDPTILANWAMLLVSPAHAIGGALHTADTLANLKTKISAPDILITSQAAEISTIAAKATPTAADILLIEDAADSNKKKKITIGNLTAPQQERLFFPSEFNSRDAYPILRETIQIAGTSCTYQTVVLNDTPPGSFWREAVINCPSATNWNKGTMDLDIYIVPLLDTLPGFNQIKIGVTIFAEPMNADISGDIGGIYQYETLIMPLKNCIYKVSFAGITVQRLSAAPLTNPAHLWIKYVRTGKGDDGDTYSGDVYNLYTVLKWRTA